MYYVPDGTTRCGFYECKECGYRFLDLETEEAISCPSCAEEFDPEIGPDEVLLEERKDAVLLRIVEGEDVEKMDALLSLAITGGNYEWI